MEFVDKTFPLGKILDFIKEDEIGLAINLIHGFDKGVARDTVLEGIVFKIEIGEFPLGQNLNCLLYTSEEWAMMGITQ